MTEERIFKFRNQELKSGGETILAGIVNVTPDSFSDGGKWYGKEEAVNHALDLVDQGAGMLDIGGESTRPGSTYVQIQEEIDRIVPVIKELKEKVDVPISVDTWKADVAEAAIDAGADIINDITGLIGDPRMAEVVGKSDAGLIMMFNPVIVRPNHKSASIFPSFGGEGVFTDKELKEFETMPIDQLMLAYFEKALDLADQHGISRDRIQLDPGIGFGLTKKENLTLIQRLQVLHEKGFQVFLGVSRKRFIVNIMEENGINMDVETERGFKNRDIASSVLTALATYNGVEVVRVHSIEEHKMAQLIASHVRFADVAEDTNLGAYSN